MGITFLHLHNTVLLAYSLLCSAPFIHSVVQISELLCALG